MVKLSAELNNSRPRAVLNLGAARHVVTKADAAALLNFATDAVNHVGGFKSVGCGADARNFLTTEIQTDENGKVSYVLYVVDGDKSVNKSLSQEDLGAVLSLAIWVLAAPTHRVRQTGK